MKHLAHLLTGIGYGVVISVIIIGLFMALIQMMRPAHADEPRLQSSYDYNDGAYSQLSNAMQDMLVIEIGDNSRVGQVTILMNAGSEDYCAESNYLLTALQQLVDAKVAEDPSRAHYYDIAKESIDRAWCKQ